MWDPYRRLVTRWRTMQLLPSSPGNPWPIAAGEQVTASLRLLQSDSWGDIEQRWKDLTVSLTGSRLIANLSVFHSACDRFVFILSLNNCILYRRGRLSLLFCCFVMRHLEGIKKKTLVLLSNYINGIVVCFLWYLHIWYFCTSPLPLFLLLLLSSTWLCVVVDRQTDRQADRQNDRQNLMLCCGGQTDSQTDIQTGQGTTWLCCGEQTDRQTDKTRHHLTPVLRFAVGLKFSWSNHLCNS